MKKLLVYALIGLCITKTAFSQSEELMVHDESNRLYLVHTVAPKENWYSVGRLFNLSPKEIAPFNNSNLDKPLSIGQHLDIPLNSHNFSQNGEKAGDETFVAVYHTVRGGESIAIVCAAHNNLSPELFKKWNHISKESLKPGSHLVVGYLKVKSAQSALAKFSGGDPIEVGESQIKKAEPSSTVGYPVTKEEKKNPAPPVVKPVSPVTAPSSTNSKGSSHSNGGYFGVEYNEGSKSTSGSAETFKSTSGWNDGKYYALMNNVPIGTIIKVIAPATQKSIYAKVLGAMPDIRENAGLAVRISNAAASELGEGEYKFNVEIRY